MQAYHFFRPLLSPTRAWVAFKWNTQPANSGNLLEAAEITGRCAPLLEAFPLFFPCRPDWLGDSTFTQLLRNSSPDRLIPCLPAAAAAQPETTHACQQLRSKNHHVAIEIKDGEGLPNLQPNMFDHLIIDAQHARTRLPLIDLINAHNNGFHLVASGVPTHELFDWACAKRFSLSSGEFIAVNDSRAPADADTARLKLLKLLSLVVQDADTRDIEEIFRQEPKLSYNLLRLVNSVAVAPKVPITGFNQAITVLGRRQLQRWLQLLIYANQFTQGSQPNPLLQLAAARGRLMESLVSNPLSKPALSADDGIEEIAEAAFMVGIFSLLDTLLHMPMTEVLASLPVAPPIAAALCEREGPLGRLLTAVTSADSGNYEVSAALLGELGINPDYHAEAQITAYAWASRINLE